MVRESALDEAKEYRNPGVGMAPATEKFMAVDSAARVARTT
jgi:hypothetical protein